MHVEYHLRVTAPTHYDAKIKEILENYSGNRIKNEITHYVIGFEKSPKEVDHFHIYFKVKNAVKETTLRTHISKELHKLQVPYSLKPQRNENNKIYCCKDHDVRFYKGFSEEEIEVMKSMSYKKAEMKSAKIDIISTVYTKIQEIPTITDEEELKYKLIELVIEEYIARLKAMPQRHQIVGTVETLFLRYLWDKYGRKSKQCRNNIKLMTGNIYQDLSFF